MVTAGRAAKGWVERFGFRLRRGIGQYGAFGLVRESAKRIVSQEEEHVWYVLDLKRAERRELGEGYELRLADEADVELIRKLPAIPVREAYERVANGVQLWFVLEGREPAFACFVFPRSFPLEAARSGEFEMPAGVAFLENAFTHPDHRGKGVGPAAVTAIVEQLRAQGYEVLIIRVGVENVPSRRAAEKVGFRAASIMHRRRRGLRTRVAFRDEETELTAPEAAIVKRLECGLIR